MIRGTTDEETVHLMTSLTIIQDKHEFWRQTIDNIDDGDDNDAGDSSCSTFCRADMVNVVMLIHGAGCQDYNNNKQHDDVKPLSSAQLMMRMMIIVMMRMMLMLMILLKTIRL